ncbi:MAG TPA: hypothetical protein VML75_20645 [Kofleriaceae bacterium]|nr:hypothetical protein [Kofleriaceae bacterium]
MMRKFGLFITAAALSSFVLGGCFVRSGPGSSKHESKSSKCKPSQYWDGNQCKHKGKGQGSRKHDGR